MRRAGVFDRRARLGRRDAWRALPTFGRGTEKRCRDTRRPAIAGALASGAHANPRPSLAHLPLTTTCRQGPLRSSAQRRSFETGQPARADPGRSLKMLFAMPSLDRTDGCLMDRLDVFRRIRPRAGVGLPPADASSNNFWTSVAMKSFLAIAALLGIAGAVAQSTCGGFGSVKTAATSRRCWSASTPA